MSTTESSASGRKNAQIVKNWIDSGLAKCHEIAVLYPSSRNPPAWIGKIHGISFCDTSALSSAANPKSNIQNSSSGDSSPAIACYSINRAKGLERRAIILTGLPAWEECAKNDYQARTFVLGATHWASKKKLSMLD